MAQHIPFVSGKASAAIAAKQYPRSPLWRVPLDRIEKFQQVVPADQEIWLDPAFDGLDRLPGGVNPNWLAFINRFSGATTLVDPTFHAKPDQKLVEKVVSAMLNAAQKFKPAWLTVPQFPLVDGNERNKINQALATATATWNAKHSFRGKLILPLVFSNQSQLNKKTARNAKLKVAEKCFRLAGCHGLWIVDSSLHDLDGSPTFQKVRFPALIALHSEIAALFPDATTIAGPYWGMNLVLWARGLVTYPAIGLGGGYQYHVAGGIRPQSKARIAVAPLRRLAVADIEFRRWLDRVVQIVPQSDPTHVRFSNVLKAFGQLADPSVARRQVARIYKEWYDVIQAAPRAGRALALYQDLSSAYVLGKTFPDLPKTEGTARRPERVAEYLMLQCL